MRESKFVLRRISLDTRLRGYDETLEALRCGYHPLTCIFEEGTKDTKVAVQTIRIFRTLRTLRVHRGELSFANFALFAPFAVNYPIPNRQLSETWLRRPNHQAMKINGAKTNVISSVTAEALLMLPLYQ